MHIDADRFDRQKRIGGWNQDKVSGASALVVGGGALGNEVVKLLLQIGANKITLVDFDKVVKANLNRCIFFNEHDAEKQEFKGNAIVREAKKINANARLIPILKKIEELPEEFYTRFDFAFGCLDNLGARLHLNAHCYHAGISLIDGGMFGFNGRVQVAKPPSACLECSVSARDYKNMWKKYSCTGDALDFLDPKTPAIATTTSIVAGIQVNEFLKLLFGEPSTLVGKTLHYDGLKQETRVFEVSKRRSCPVHPE
jgi:molybdopterin/thiamine biosynthesis adenylyltransferase